MDRSKPKNLLSKREEEALLEAGRQVLFNDGYPNPERVGCPGQEVLKAIAIREMPLSEAVDFIDHMGCCSPCFIEYTGFRKQAQRRKTLELAFAAVALVVVIGGGVWLWKTHRFPGKGGKPNVPTVAAYQPVTLDLRNWMVFRGEQPPLAHSGPVQLPRGRLGLTILLPVGKEAGNYVVQISTEFGKPAVTSAGTAVIQKGITVLKTKLDLSSLSSGSYVLRVGESGTEGTAYPLVVR